jgi:hypothetical protein
VWCFVVFWAKTPRLKSRRGVFFSTASHFHAYKAGPYGHSKNSFEKRTGGISVVICCLLLVRFSSDRLGLEKQPRFSPVFKVA